MKSPSPGAKRYFFIPSTDGHKWELAEATYRRGTWHVAYPGNDDRDGFPELPPEEADWVELVPPHRAPRGPWPANFLTPRTPKAAVAEEDETATAPARKPKAVPRKAVPTMSRELEDLMVQEQKAQKAPEGKAKCPLCGVILEPTRNKRVRTHDDPIKGRRCEASHRPWAQFKGRPQRPKRG